MIRYIVNYWMPVFKTIKDIENRFKSTNPYCPLPVDEVQKRYRGYAEMEADGYFDEDRPRVIKDRLDSMQIVVPVYLWDKYRQVYIFDKDLLDALWEQVTQTSETDVLPNELLARMPYPSIYIKFANTNGVAYYDKDYNAIDGFLATMDYSSKHKVPYLRLTVIYENNLPKIDGILLFPDKTIGECISDTMKYIGKADVAELAAKSVNNSLTMLAIQCLLYIQAANADIQSRPSAKKKAKKQKAKAPKQIKVHDVGVKVGKTLRVGSSNKQAVTKEYAKSDQSSPKSPHIRRGHWHHYWKGAHDSDERKLILKWTAPTFVNSESSGGGTIHPVKSPTNNINKLFKS